MRPDEIEFLVELVRIRAGYALDRDRTYLMDSRLAPVARREGFGSIRELLLTTRQRKDERLVWAIVEALVCGETSFFRDPEPFQRLRQEILPALANARVDQPLRILSAGCATGQEPYSLAMIIDEDRAGLSGAGVEIIGVDLSERGLEKARSGVYSQFEVQRGLPIRSLVRHFERRDDVWTISPALRASVRWRRANLNADLRAMGRFDVILCRNVMCRMDPAAASRLLEQLGQMVAADGYFMLGVEEQAGGLQDRFQAVQPGLLVRGASARAAV